MRQSAHESLEVRMGPVFYHENDCLIQKAGRKWYSRYYNSAVAIPSPELDQLCEIARNNNVHIQVGIIEKDGGTLYCTALLLSRDGAVLSRHRKVYNTYPYLQSIGSNRPTD